MRGVSAVLVAFAIAAIPTAYASHRLTTWRHFRVVREGRLYRSGQLSRDALQEVIREHGIKTVICLRSLSREGDPHLKNDEELWCRDWNVRYIRLNPVEWDSRGIRDHLDEFLKWIDDPASGAILIHCFAGLHRTGVYCAVFRMERDGWSNDEAIAEMHAIGYFQEDPAALQFLREYVPRKRHPSAQ